MKINKLKLNNFRNHESISFDISKNIIAITGLNGVGKTNILEAISLLTPGRGIRKAKLADLQKMSETEKPWSIFAEIENDGETNTIGTGFDAQKFAETGKEKRIVKINGEPQRGNNTLSDYVCLTWLTPREDQTFASNTTAREFLDRLCELFYPGYSAQIAVYNNAKSQRRNLLSRSQHNDVWLTSLETQMAQKAIAITYARIEVLERINSAMQVATHSTFPPAHGEIAGEIEDIIKSNSALETENQYLALLKSSRMQDSQSGRTAYGIHNTKLRITHLHKNQLAEYCSTGEQKALLLSLTLASVVAKRSFSNVTPIVLLDEIIAHLDEEKRHKLLQFLLDINAQVWTSSVTEKEFLALGQNVQNILL